MPTILKPSDFFAQKESWAREIMHGCGPTMAEGKQPTFRSFRNLYISMILFMALVVVLLMFFGTQQYNGTQYVGVYGDSIQNASGPNGGSCANRMCEGWRNVRKSATPTPCKPKHQIVYIKTHKTGSSTIGTILERYGHRRGLNFALPKTSHFFSQVDKFKASFVYQYDLKDKNGTLVWPALGGFHIIANHARYNRAEQSQVILNATFITIIRDPASQFESAFSFFHLDKFVPNHTMPSVFKMDAKRFFNLSATSPLGFIRNGQMYDLGLDQATQDPGSADAIIKSLSKEMDLVMITEYFDESLILLKKLLCWEFDDIVYVSQLVRKSSVRKAMDSDLIDKIYKWNHADLKLYQHFNRTFWERVREYGPDFQHDLETFRDIKTATTKPCLANPPTQLDGHKTKSLTHLRKLPRNASQECQDFVRLDEQWVSIIRDSMSKRSQHLLANSNDHAETTNG